MTEATVFDSLSALRDNALEIKEMVAYKKWKAIMDGQIEGRAKEALNPMKNQEEVLERNYKNGEAAGIMLTFQMLDQLVSDLSDEIKRRQEESQDDQNPVV